MQHLIYVNKYKQNYMPTEALLKLMPWHVWLPINREIKDAEAQS